MANIPPPKLASHKIEPKKETRKRTIKTVNKAKPTKMTEQTPPDSIKPLQLKLPEMSKNEFKAYAAMRGKSMNKLFLEMFELYKQNDESI